MLNQEKRHSVTTACAVVKQGMLAIFQVLSLLLPATHPTHAQISTSDSRVSDEKIALVLHQNERRCLFGGQIGKQDACIPVIKKLLSRSGFADGNKLWQNICKEINKRSNYDALGKENGSMAGGSLAFDGQNSVRSVINKNGLCTLYTSEYNSGYQVTTTSDGNLTCTSLILNEIVGKWIISTSTVEDCENKGSKSIRTGAVITRVGELRAGRPIGSSLLLGEIIIEKE